MHKTRNTLRSQVLLQARRLGIRPKHSFGQHFLVDESVYERILQAAQLTSLDNVIEIGTGLGTLTAELAKNAGRVVTVESDHDLVERLPQVLSAYPNVTLVPGNILAIPISELLRLFPQQKERYALVANLPYNITAKTLDKFLQSNKSCIRMVLLLQREVAKRLVAVPGDMSMLSLVTQWRAEVEYIADVSAESFLPPPKVQSAIVRLLPRTTPPFPLPQGCNIEQVFWIAKFSFSQKRKMLGNSLSAGLRLPIDEVKEALLKVGIGPDLRPQDIAIDQWISIASALLKSGVKFPQKGISQD